MNQSSPIEVALKTIAASPEMRGPFLRALVAWEQAAGIIRNGLRDKTSGPLVDALFAKDEVVRKALADGTQIEFLYRSKIAREFLMSTPAAPDHVWEPQTTRLLKLLAHTTRSAVVGGAYFGDHVVLLAKAMRAQSGQVHAFEPCPAQRSMLENNLKLNMLDNVQVRGQGLWDVSNTQQMLDASDAYGSLMKEVSAENAVQVDTVSLNDYLGGLGIASVDLVMLDLEGAEERALHGAKRYLEMPVDKAPNLIFEINREYVDWSNGLDKTEIVQWLTGMGYQVFAIRDIHANHDMKDSPIEIIPADDVYLKGPPHGFNMLAFKRASLVTELGLSIVRAVSPKLFPDKDPAIFHPVGGMP